MSERDIEARLAAVRKAYITSLQEKQRDIEQLWQNLQTHWDAQNFMQLYRLVHSLAGSAETFGFAELTRRARALVDALRPLETRPHVAADLTQLQDKFAALRRQLEQAASVRSEDA